MGLCLASSNEEGVPCYLSSLHLNSAELSWTKMKVPQDTRFIVVCGMRRRQFSVSSALAKAILGDSCEHAGHGGGRMMVISGKGQAFLGVSHSDCSALPSQQPLQVRAVGLGQARSREAEKSA